MPRITLSGLQGDAAAQAAAPSFEARVEIEETVCELPAYEVTANGSGMF